jgi:hypothetical protein
MQMRKDNCAAAGLRNENSGALAAAEPFHSRFRIQCRGMILQASAYLDITPLYPATREAVEQQSAPRTYAHTTIFAPPFPLSPV